VPPIGSRLGGQKNHESAKVKTDALLDVAGWRPPHRGSCLQQLALKMFQRVSPAGGCLIASLSHSGVRIGVDTPKYTALEGGCCRTLSDDNACSFACCHSLRCPVVRVLRQQPRRRGPPAFRTAAVNAWIQQPVGLAYRQATT
jgi:hypothetical protein